MLFAVFDPMRDRRTGANLGSIHKKQVLLVCSQEELNEQTCDAVIFNKYWISCLTG